MSTHTHTERVLAPKLKQETTESEKPERRKRRHTHKLTIYNNVNLNLFIRAQTKNETSTVMAEIKYNNQ